MTARPFRSNAQPAKWSGAVRHLPWLCLVLAGCASTALAQTAATDPAPPEAAASSPVQKSALDAPMFYQLLVGEMEAQAGRLGNAYEVMLDAARRTRDGALFQRAMELALQGRQGDKALQAARAWRLALPDSVDALRHVVQLLAALNRPEELAQPLQELLRLAPAADRSAVISSVPRFLAGLPDKARALSAAELALAPFVNAEATRTASRVTLGRLALAAGQGGKALTLAQRAASEDPSAIGPSLLAIELMDSQPSAEPLVLAHLARAGTPAALRMAYARALEQQQRLAEAVAAMRQSLQADPSQTQGWLGLGAHLVGLHEPTEALAALEQFVTRAEQETANPAADTAPSEEGPSEASMAQRALDWARNLQAQAWFQLGNTAAAAQALSKVPTARDDLGMAQQRAELLRRQGQLDAGREWLRQAPLQGRADAVSRLQAEASLLREDRRWQEAYELLLNGVRGAPDDSSLIYELAMTAERLGRLEDMEVLLRRVMVLKPDHAHAFNALGYSLAERGLRLDEARDLLTKALSLAPRDAFIIDSLGWLEFRAGRTAEALRLLQQSWRQRPHAEVAAHLGEVLWVSGKQDEARAVWRDGAAREADNTVLRDTLQRLQITLAP